MCPSRGVVVTLLGRGRWGACWAMRNNARLIINDGQVASVWDTGGLRGCDGEVRQD